MKRIALSLISGGALIAAFAGDASATSPFSSCPPSYVVWAVGTMSPPYLVPAQVDANGNNDGIVCAMPIGDRTFQYNGQTFQLYNFIDNSVAPEA